MPYKSLLLKSPSKVDNYIGLNIVDNIYMYLIFAIMKLLKKFTKNIIVRILIVFGGQ